MKIESSIKNSLDESSWLDLVKEIKEKYSLDEGPGYCGRRYEGGRSLGEQYWVPFSRKVHIPLWSNLFVAQYCETVDIDRKVPVKGMITVYDEYWDEEEVMIIDYEA